MSEGPRILSRDELDETIHKINYAETIGIKIMAIARLVESYEGLKAHYKEAMKETNDQVKEKYFFKELSEKFAAERDSAREALAKILDDSWYTNGFVPADDEQARRHIMVDRLNEVRIIASDALKKTPY